MVIDVDVLVGSDDDDNALWMDSMGIMQGQTTIMYPHTLHALYLSNESAFYGDRD